MSRRDEPTRDPAPEAARAPGSPRYAFDRSDESRLLGTGTFAKVWRGTDTLTGHAVAGKFFAPDAGAGISQAEALARFRAEARALADFDHSFIVRLLEDRSADPGDPHVVIEHGETTLWDDVQDHGPGFDGANARRLAWIVQLAQALAEMHRHGYVHRDLKMGNVLVKDERGETIRLIDFGMARAPDGGRTSPGLMGCGTPGYLAPEQALDFAQATPASDVYAFGACCWGIATGGLYVEPAVGGSPGGGAPLLGPADASREGVPAWLRPLLARCLDHDPRKRPRDGAALVAALAEARDAPRARRVPPAPAPPHRPATGGGEADRIPSIHDWLPRDRRPGSGS